LKKRRANGAFLRGCVGVRGDGFKVWLDGDVWGLVELNGLSFLVDYGKVSDEWAGTVRRGL
jgi:hypothetical protein